MKKQKFLLLLLVVTFCLGLNVMPAMAVPIVLNVSPDPIYSGDTVTIDVLPFIGNTEYFAWANMQASAATGLVDTTGPMSAVINGMDGETNTFGDGGAYYSLNAYNGTGVTFLPDSYGGAWGSDPSTVSGAITFIAGLPGTYHFSTTFHTGDLNMHDTWDWWQPSQLISPPWGEVYITVLDGDGSGGQGDPSVPEPGTMLLLGSGLLGLVGFRKKS